jgi:hypothetical protein
MSLNLALVTLGNTFIIFLFCLNVVTLASLLRILMPAVSSCDAYFCTPSQVQAQAQVKNQFCFAKKCHYPFPSPFLKTEHQERQVTKLFSEARERASEQW